MKFFEKISGLYRNAVARFGIRHVIVALSSVVIAMLAASFISVNVIPNDKSNAIIQPTLPPKISEATLDWQPRNYSWQAPNDQEAVNFFDIMTPPNIYEKNGTIIYEKCDQDLIFGVFPLTLKSISKKLYRIQFEGYIDLSIKKPSDKSTIILFDTENNESIKCKEGAEIIDKEFIVKSFSFDQRYSNGAKITRPIVVINDLRDGKLVELTNEPEYYDDKYDITLEDLVGRTYVFKDNCTEVSVGDATCRLNEFDFEKKSAKITLTDVDGQEFVRELTIEE